MPVDDRLPFAIVGLNFGSWVARTQVASGPGAPHFRLAAVCDLDEDKARALAAEFGVPAYASLEDLLARTEIPAIGLFTGPAKRAEAIRTIIRTGRDVMTTKPFELDHRQADSVLREASDAGRIVHLNSPAPDLPPDLAAIRAWERRGLGRPVGCRADVWCSYREKPDGSWYDDPVRCPAAPLFRLGIYVVNDLVRLFGPVESVQVAQSRLFTGRPTPDNAHLALRFANGALGSVFASFCVDDGQPYRNSLILAYERGSVYRNPGAFSPGTPIEGCRLSLAIREPGGSAREEHATLAAKSGDYQWAEFRAALRDRRLPDESFRATVVNAIAVVDAMRRAVASGARETVDPSIGP